MQLPAMSCHVMCHVTSEIKEMKYKVVTSVVKLYIWLRSNADLSSYPGMASQLSGRECSGDTVGIVDFEPQGWVLHSIQWFQYWNIKIEMSRCCLSSFSLAISTEQLTAAIYRLFMLQISFVNPLIFYHLLKIVSWAPATSCTLSS